MEKYFKLLTYITVFLLVVYFCIETIKADKVELSQKVTGDKIDLNTKWTFFPNRFVPPNMIDNKFDSTVTEVPGYWKSDIKYGTYAKKVKVPKSWINNIKTIYVPKIYTSYSIWIDGDLKGTVGKPGKGHDSSKPFVIPQKYNFVPKSDSVSIVIQVANNHYRKSGISGTISVGEYNEVSKKHKQKVYIDWFSIGSLITIGLFLLNLFILNREDKSTLFFGLFCMLYGLRVFLKGELYIYQFIPNFDWNIAIKYDYIILFLTFPVFMKYLELTFKKEANPFVFRIAIIFSSIFITLIILTEPKIFSYSMIALQFASLLVLIYFYSVLWKAIRNRNNCANILIFVSIIFALTVINDILYTEQYINTTELIPIGLVVFCAGQLYMICNNIAEAYRKIESLNQELDINQKEIIYTLGEITETRSKETGNHVRRVAMYTHKLAHLLGLGEEAVEKIKLASPLHDIGKVAVPDTILNKPGKLTEEEYEIIKTHTTVGYQMLMHSTREIMQIGAQIALTHHEKFDGSGYPNQIKGTEIPLVGRITAVADVFDALSNDRIYKKAWKMEDVINYFREQRGKHFDPEIVDCLLSNLDEFIRINNLYKDV
ncbi:HD domain-containing phosphohydrolase [Bacillus suaedaesalsae]|uniref:HD domain-containing protein n=1 Tax=Bacillus suaedaesalsae TaxID=2810349 RepID=A0ABS2DEZ3_9BACI|nr:HD domain-containing phosphohydrolase [Bacillus suaedaesalsae]MBM6616590.1 HD domain-containing protein [Bacillus suaedaesalsae]